MSNLLYPTQRVAEGVMFSDPSASQLVSPSVLFFLSVQFLCVNVHIHRKFWFSFFLGVTAFLNFEILPKWKILLKQFVSATSLKPLNRISWNFVVMKDLMCRCAYPGEFWFFFFLGVTPLFKLGNLTNIRILLETRQRNYTETAQQNFVKLCNYEGHNFF